MNIVMNKNMEKEKLTSKTFNASANFVENQLTSFDKSNCLSSSFRVYKDGFAGIYYQQGNISDEDGFSKAEKNLELKRGYNFEIESGERCRDKSEKPLSDEEILLTSKKILKYLRKKHPDYSFSGSVETNIWEESAENSKGMDYKCKDANNSIYTAFKHKDSKDICDGDIYFTQRTLNLRRFYKIADNILDNFAKEVPMPDECIIINKYYEYASFLRNCLSLENLKSGTSLLSGKIGQQVFSKDLTVLHDVSDKTSWMTSFWDGDGVVNKGDKITFIKEGKLLRGYCDKIKAKKYKVKTTGNAGFSYSDIPNGSFVNMTLKIGKKSAKEMLGGKLAIFPILASGGGFKEHGEYTMPVQIGLLTDGEKILGHVPPFTISSNIFDMFGKDFLGIAKFNKEIFNDKVMLFKCDVGKL